MMAPVRRLGVPSTLGVARREWQARRRPRTEAVVAGARQPLGDDLDGADGQHRLVRGAGDPGR
jgi:hypothetical protein